MKSPEEIKAGEVEFRRQQQALGRLVFPVEDKPGEVYERHAHEDASLYPTDGVALMRLDGDRGEWFIAEPGVGIDIAAWQEHEAVTGPTGWNYLFGCGETLARKEGLL